MSKSPPLRTESTNERQAFRSIPRSFCATVMHCARSNHARTNRNAIQRSIPTPINTQNPVRAFPASLVKVSDQPERELKSAPRIANGTQEISTSRTILQKYALDI